MSRARVPSRPDWHAVGRSLRAEHGAAMAPAAFAALVRERWPDIAPDDLYALGVGYACGNGRRSGGL